MFQTSRNIKACLTFLTGHDVVHMTLFYFQQFIKAYYILVDPAAEAIPRCYVLRPGFPPLTDRHGAQLVPGVFTTKQKTGIQGQHSI